MKKIFFLLSFMHVGGVERSFLSLLHTIDREEYEVHLGLLKMAGDLMNDIPPWVKVHHIDYFDQYTSIINDAPKEVIRAMVRKGQIIRAAKYAYCTYLDRCNGTRWHTYCHMMADGPTLDTHFDIAVAYAGPSQAIDFYVSQKVKADKKIGWIHFDIGRFGCDHTMVKKLYTAFDHINIVSESAKAMFDRNFPMLSDRTRLHYNVIDISDIQAKAALGATFPADKHEGTDHKLKILTIGRLTHEKGPDLAIQAAAMLAEKGVDFVWYIIGPNPQAGKYEALVKSLELEDRVKITGAMTNPYGYLKDCDIYVQPSRHEGWGLSVQEAKCFGVPIIATDCPSICEQLTGYPRGHVSKADSTAICNEIIKALQQISQVK